MDKKRLFPILLVLITFLSVYYLLDSRKNADSTYQAYLAAARSAAEDHILVDAEENYRKAMELKSSAELVLEVGEVLFHYVQVKLMMFQMLLVCMIQQ